MAHALIGQPAPALRAPSTNGTFDLEAHRGSWVVVYFYPKDFTPGCTTEACDFRDAMVGLNAVVVGVSPDSVEDHLRFRDEYGLPFELAADEDHAIAEAYGAWGERTLYGKKVTGILRSTFIVAPDGTVAEAMTNVKATGHVDRVRARLADLRS
jgi:peroxiredoxin Q/BCP